VPGKLDYFVAIFRPKFISPGVHPRRGDGILSDKITFKNNILTGFVREIQ
jgi:hypothetical protein